MSDASPARGQSSVGNVGGAGSREPLQGLDGVCRRVSRGSARSLAHGAVCVPQTGCGDAADGVICSVLVHTRLFDGAKVVFFFVAIQSAVEVSASSLTHWCSSEVPLDAARCRHSVHLREGGSARRCALPTQRSLARRRFRSTLRVSRNDVPRTGRKREKMGGGIPSSSGHKLSETADDGGEVRPGGGFPRRP